MPRRARFRLLIALIVGLATVGLTGAGLALVLPAGPASAAPGASASISLSGVPGSFTAGQQVTLSSTVVLGSTGINSTFRSLSATFYINSNSLTGSQVQFSWKRAAENSWHNSGLSRRNGTLSTSFNPFSGRMATGQASVQMRLTFRSSAKPQSIQIGIILKGSQQRQNSQQLAQAGPFASTIGGAAPPPATPSPTQVPSTAPATSGATAAATDGALAAGPVITTGGGEPSTGASSVGWILYVVGGLLLIAGVGVVGTMLWQRTRAQATGDGDNGNYPASEYPASEYPGSDYPASAAGRSADRSARAASRRHQRPSAPVDPTQPYPQQSQQDQFAQEPYQDQYGQQPYQDQYAQQPYQDQYGQQAYPDQYGQQPYQDQYGQQPYPDQYAQQPYQDQYGQQPYPQQSPRPGRHSADPTRPMPPM